MIQISEKVEHQLFEKWLLCWGVDELLKYKEWTMLFINIPEDKITFDDYVLREIDISEEEFTALLLRI